MRTEVGMANTKFTIVAISMEENRSWGENCSSSQWYLVYWKNNSHKNLEGWIKYQEKWTISYTIGGRLSCNVFGGHFDNTIKIYNAHTYHNF